MSFKKAIVPALACGLLTAAQALAQPPGANFPRWPGKDIVVATCDGCHDINRLRAGYTAGRLAHDPRMMQNMGAPVAARGLAGRHHVSDQEFPRTAAPAAAHIAGPVTGQASTMWTLPTHRIAPARSAGRP